MGKGLGGKALGPGGWVGVAPSPSPPGKFWVGVTSRGHWAASPVFGASSGTVGGWRGLPKIGGLSQTGGSQDPCSFSSCFSQAPSAPRQPPKAVPPAQPPPRLPPPEPPETPTPVTVTTGSPPSPSCSPAPPRGWLRVWGGPPSREEPVGTPLTLECHFRGPPRHRPDLAPGVSPRARGGPPELPLAPGGGGHPGGPPGGPGGAGRGGKLHPDLPQTVPQRLRALLLPRGVRGGDGPELRHLRQGPR
ncbi:proline-rich protein 2-like [Corapipo altera]|uniref:proline-rich protein 2-like n=1 Tax=Corapipo altera TaxID=415028 RepID=UPI000FD67D65|nr:proline-rich protein 2-like [Corapipo altera]